MRILAIDPGNEQSAYMRLENGIPVEFGKVENEHLLRMLGVSRQLNQADRCAIEGIASYGMAVGKEVFDTCVWIGRYIQMIGGQNYRLVYRMEVKDHLCHDRRAKDANIRQALIDRFGGIQETKKGGKLYGISKDVWSALAVACTYHDLYASKEEHNA